MPRGDGTGPAGMGPMTGISAGFCAGYPVPGFTNPVGGRGYWGWGRGGGRGWRHWFYATGLPSWARAGFPAAPTSEQEQQTLKQEAQYLQDSLDAINRRIDELNKEKSE